MLYMHFLKHGIRSGNLCSTNILKGICHNRFLNAFMEFHTHLDRKGRSFVDGVGIAAFFVHHDKIRDFCKLATVFQHIRIDLELLTPAFAFFLFVFCCSFCRILSDQKLFVHINHLLRRAFRQLYTFIKKDYTVTVSGNTAEIVAYKENGSSHIFKFFKFTITFCLEEHVANRKSLINDQNLRVNVDCNSKSQTNEHTAGICLDRLIYKITDVCKVQNIL